MTAPTSASTAATSSGSLFRTEAGQTGSSKPHAFVSTAQASRPQARPGPPVPPLRRPRCAPHCPQMLPPRPLLDLPPTPRRQLYPFHSPIHYPPPPTMLRATAPSTCSPAVHSTSRPNAAPKLVGDDPAPAHVSGAAHSRARRPVLEADRTLVRPQRTEHRVRPARLRVVEQPPQRDRRVLQAGHERHPHRPRAPSPQSARARLEARPPPSGTPTGRAAPRPRHLSGTSMP